MSTANAASIEPSNGMNFFWSNVSNNIARNARSSDEQRLRSRLR